MAPQLSRRDALRLAAPTFAIVSVGCLSSGANQSPSQSTSPSMSPAPTESPTRTPNNIGAGPVPSCPDGYIASYDPWWEVVGSGPLGGFDLSLNKERFTKGELLVAKLRNITDGPQETGIRNKVDIQYQGSNGWHTILGIDEHQTVAFPQVALTHKQNEGFTWRVPLSQEKLAAGNEGGINSSFHACQPIKPGQYRFVYWGVGGADEAIGAPFEVV